jgi:hypothetical protein
MLRSSRNDAIRELVSRQFTERDGDIFDEVVELHTGGRLYSDYTDEEMLEVWDEMDDTYGVEEDES